MSEFKHTLSSHTTSRGFRSHSIQTTAREFAFELFSHALDVDNEPDFAAAQGVFSIEFFADDAECAAVIEAAQTSAATLTPHKVVRA